MLLPKPDYNDALCEKFIGAYEVIGWWRKLHNEELNDL
jgi:hypothetical protein